jgi:hypothetical protein
MYAVESRYGTLSHILYSWSTYASYDDQQYFVFVIYLRFIRRSATCYVRDLPEPYMPISNILFSWFTSALYDDQQILCSWFTSAFYDDQQHFMFVIYLSLICRSATFYFHDLPQPCITISKFYVRDLPEPYMPISNILFSWFTSALYDDQQILFSWFTSAFYDDQQHFMFVIYLRFICRSATFCFRDLP